jgi:hypothetical protein
MSRALRAKEENYKYSLALKKATAEAALGNNYSHKITDFAEMLGSSKSSNRSQMLSSYTADGGVSTGTNTTETSNDPQLN